MSSDFDGWRKKIDEIDRRLLELLNERSHCAIKIGTIKKSRNLPALSPKREEDILDRMTKANCGPLENDSIQRLFEAIINETRAVERYTMENESKEDLAPDKE
tara:strand:- start:61 stop:369 length:309 start_codon:yes stop_codon:yes gene_type:complete